MTPLLKMHTLGHDFVPDPIHAGGLRYHGMSPLISHIYELGLMEAIAIEQTECFAAAVQFARTEGIVPAPEPTHALAAAIREALALQGDRRGEGDPDRAVRARALSTWRRTTRTSPAGWSTRRSATRGSPPASRPSRPSADPCAHPGNVARSAPSPLATSVSALELRGVRTSRPPR